MKKSLILLILPLLLAAGCGDDRSPVDVTEPLSPEEAQVVANCLTVQQAVEAFAAGNNGDYPMDVYIDSNLAGENVIRLLPGSTSLQNPFTQAYTEPVNGGIAINPGETAYTPVGSGPINTGYFITGFGADSLIITISK